MKPEYDVDIMMIGHFARDRLVVDGRAEVSSGGGVYYGSVALRRLGLSVAAVTRLHPDDFPRLEELRQVGVDVFAQATSQTSGIENVYDSADMEQRICTPLGFAGRFEPKEIPDLAARTYAVVPIISGEADLALLQALARRGPVALDVQGFVRVREGGRLVFRPWPDMDKGLSQVTYLKVDQAEAELLTGQTDLRVAAHALAAYGPNEVVLTQSSGVTVLADDCLYFAPFNSRSLAGRTGRGDTCFATYLGGRLTRSPQEATRLAAAVTTLKQEKPGPWRGTLGDIERAISRTTSESGCG
jgi:sugar/nucleoside kinase (ribokinase family)